MAPAATRLALLYDIDTMTPSANSLSVAEFSFGSLTVRAASSPSRAELHLGCEGELDLTGHVPWLACLPLCEFIAASGERLFADKPRVVELGAGVGLPGLIAGRWASELRLTDKEPSIIAQLWRSIEENTRIGQLLPSKTSAELLDWRASQLPHTIGEGTFDVVLAADCVYYAESAELLVGVVQRLLAPRGVLLLSYADRWRDTDIALAQALERACLRCQLAPGAPAVHESGRQARVYAVWRAEAGAPAALLALGCHARRNEHVAAAREDAPPSALHALEAMVAQLASDGLRARLSTFTCGAGEAEGEGAATQEPLLLRLEVESVGLMMLGPAALHALAAALAAALRSDQHPPCAALRVRTLVLVGHRPYDAGCEGGLALRHEEGGAQTPAAASSSPSLARVLQACASDWLVEVDLSRNRLGSGVQLRGVERGAEAEAGEPGQGRSLRALCAVLSTCSGLRVLRLAANGLSDAEGLQLAACLLARPRLPGVPAAGSLSELDVSENRLGHAALAALVRACRGLSPAECADGLAETGPLALGIAHNLLSQDGVEALALALPARLLSLSLGLQWLGDEGASRLASCALARCSAWLQALDVSHATSAWGVCALVRALAAADGGCALRRLEARGCRLGDEGTVELAALLLRLPQLEELGLAHNAIGWEGAEALADGLACCRALRTLGLSHNSIGYEGADALADALASRGSLSRLTALELCECECDEEALTALCAALASRGHELAPSLALDMRRNPISAEGVARSLHLLRGTGARAEVDLRMATSEWSEDAGMACRALADELRVDGVSVRLPAFSRRALECGY